MANFNEKINSHQEFVLRDQKCDYFIERIGSMGRLKPEFDYNVHNLKSGYRLFIQYKYTCRIQKLAGRCFMWVRTSSTSYSIEVRILKCDSNEDFSYFGDPVFDSIAGAIFITDNGVVTYGDTWIDAVEISGEHVVCNAYVCGLFVSKYRIPAEVFDRLFGLKENFPEQYEKVFGKAEDATHVQEENDLIEEAKRNIESCWNLLGTNACQLERAMDTIKCALIDIEDQKCELDDMLSKLDNTLRKLKQGFELSGNSE